MTKHNPLITIDEAIARSKKAGFEQMNRRWWQSSIDKGVLETIPGPGNVVYIRSVDVDLMIQTTAQATHPTGGAE